MRIRVQELYYPENFGWFPIGIFRNPFGEFAIRIGKRWIIILSC